MSNKRSPSSISRGGDVYQVVLDLIDESMMGRLRALKIDRGVNEAKNIRRHGKEAITKERVHLGTTKLARALLC